MPPNTSTFIEEARKREAWLPPALEREGSEPTECESLLRTAALFHGVAQSIPVPREAEDASRARAVAYMNELRWQRSRGDAQTEEAWYLRFRSALKYVFTLGRRR